MRRRELFKAAGASLAAIAAPRIGRAERPNKLVFVPTEDLGVLDPVVTGIRSTRNHAYLVFRHALRHRYELDSPASLHSMLHGVADNT